LSRYFFVGHAVPVDFHIAGEYRTIIYKSITVIILAVRGGAADFAALYPARR